MPVIDRLPLPEVRWQVPPRQAGPQPEENSIDHAPVALPAPASSDVRRQVRFQQSPLGIGEITTPHTKRNDSPLGESLDPSDTP